MASEKEMPMDEEQMEDDEIIVVMTDDDGNEYYYVQELILEVQGDKYALLVPTCEDDEEEEGHCHCHDHNSGYQNRHNLSFGAFRTEWQKELNGF